ncbi:hypothetical protein CCP3SC1AL1_440009 [Gammaproteobacteria bacterium]
MQRKHRKIKEEAKTWKIIAPLSCQGEGPGVRSIFCDLAVPLIKPILKRYALARVMLLATAPVFAAETETPPAPSHSVMVTQQGQAVHFSVQGL